MFDISDITEEELPYLGVLKAVLGYMDTEHYNYADLANEINLMTGGISSQINIYADTKKKTVSMQNTKYVPRFFIRIWKRGLDFFLRF